MMRMIRIIRTMRCDFKLHPCRCVAPTSNICGVIQEQVKRSRGRKPRILPEGWSRIKNKPGYMSITGIYAKSFADIVKIESSVDQQVSDESRSVIEEQKTIIRDKDVEIASLLEQLENAKECSLSMHSMSDDLTFLITDLRNNANAAISEIKSLIEQRDDMQVRLEASNESVNMLVRRQADSDKILTEGQAEVGMCHSNLSWICNVPMYACAPVACQAGRPI